MKPERGSIPHQTEYSFEDYVSKLSMYAIEGKTDSEIINTWTAIEKAMSDNSFSESHLKDMLECALNLRGTPETSRPLLNITAPSQDFVFSTPPDTDPISTSTSTKSSQVLQHPSAEGSTRESSESQAKAICYICCSYMRLIAKPANHIQKALTKIKCSYGRLYGGFSTLLRNFNPRTAWSKRIKTGLIKYKAIAGTLSYHLGTAEASLSRSDADYALCRYLLFQYTEMMGMQIYKMSLALMHHMKYITPGLFLTWIHNDKSEECTREIMKIATGVHNPENPTKNYYWKYAKMVDPTYFLNLSIRRNKFLGAVLAKLLKNYGLCDIKEYADPENMVAFMSLGATEIEAINKYVDKIVTMYDEVMDKSGVGGIIWRLAKGFSVPAKLRAATGPTHNMEVEQTRPQNQQQQTTLSNQDQAETPVTKRARLV